MDTKLPPWQIEWALLVVGLIYAVVAKSWLVVALVLGVMGLTLLLYLARWVLAARRGKPRPKWGGDDE